MFLRRTERRKNGKTHHYWNVVENKRLDDGRVVQRHVLYLGEINSSQAATWRKAIEVFDEDAGRARTLALFPEDRCEAVAADASVGQLRLPEMLASPSAAMGRLLAGRTVVAGASARSVLGRWAAAQPQEDAVGSGFAGSRDLLADRTGQRMAATPAWFGNNAMADLLGADFGLCGRAQALCLSRPAA